MGRIPVRAKIQPGLKILGRFESQAKKISASPNGLKKPKTSHVIVMEFEEFQPGLKRELEHV